MKSRYWLLLIFGLSTLAVDQGTKYLAVARLTHTLDGTSGLERARAFFSMREAIGPNSSYPVIEDLWRFEYDQNPGAAWGVWTSMPSRLRQPLLAAATLIALGFLGFLFSRLGDHQRLLQAALSLVLGGAAGNLVDRVLRGFVIDFVDWHWRDAPGLRWPTFNVADAAITVGFAFMVADSLRALARESSAASSPRGRPGMPLAAPSSPANPNS